MKVNQLGERELIRQFVIPVLAQFESDYLGDDCAVLPLDAKSSLLITTDVSSRTPFLTLLQVGSFVDLGHLFATMSISDIAAMGGEPLALVAACTFEPNFSSESFGDLVAGIALACQETGTKYVGGDTKEGDSLRVVTTAVGIINSRQILSRRGAKIGDLLCVSGQIGSALQSYIRAARTKPINKSVSVVRPKPRVEFAAALASRGLATSCIDMSDGPIAAARTLGELNHVEMNLDIEALDLALLPLQEIPSDLWKTLILNVGGDYELMFTAPAQHRTTLERLGALVCGTVEKVKEAPGVKLSGPERYQKPWEHFHSTFEITGILQSMLSK